METIGLFLRLIVSLGVVLGLMWAAANVLRKRGLAPAGPRRPGRGAQVDLLARKPLGRNASIAVVRVGTRSIVVGVTEHQVTKLDDVDLTDVADEDGGTSWTVPQGPDGPTPAWRTMLEQLRERTTRR